MLSNMQLHAQGGARKGFVTGTHRLVSPTETLEKVWPVLPVFGITRVANITGLDNVGLPVVIVCRPNARSLSVSQGKGLDLPAAKASGVMEAIEAYHAEHITLPVKLATYNELRSTHKPVDVELLPQLALSPFHPDLRLLWIEGFDLLQDAPVWLPYEMVHLDYTLPFPPGSGCFATSSNGLASGNHCLEAIAHGICEVVERDANALWHASNKGMRRETRIDLSSVNDPVCRCVLEKLANANIIVSVWETTSDTGIPSFYCAFIDGGPASWRAFYPCSGSGCHPVREIALLRALTEAAQSRLTMIAGSRDDTARGDYLRAGDPTTADRIRSELLHGIPERNFQDVPTFVSDKFDEDVEWLLEHLQKTDCQSVVVVDLTNLGLNINVVRVVIPGLESAHDVPGYVPGPRAHSAMTTAKDA